MYKNVIDPGKSVSFVLKDIDIGGQNQYAMCTGPLNTFLAQLGSQYGTFQNVNYILLLKI